MLNLHSRLAEFSKKGKWPQPLGKHLTHKYFSLIQSKVSFIYVAKLVREENDLQIRNLISVKIVIAKLQLILC